MAARWKTTSASRTRDARGAARSQVHLRGTRSRFTAPQASQVLLLECPGIVGNERIHPDHLRGRDPEAASQRCEPMNPAAPVTRHFMSAPLRPRLSFSGRTLLSGNDNQKPCQVGPSRPGQTGEVDPGRVGLHHFPVISPSSDSQILSPLCVDRNQNSVKSHYRYSPAPAMISGCAVIRS